MRIKSISLGIFALLFSMTLMVSCGEAKKETKEVTEEEVSTDAEESKELHADHARWIVKTGKLMRKPEAVPFAKWTLQLKTQPK